MQEHQALDLYEFVQREGSWHAIHIKYRVGVPWRAEEVDAASTKAEWMHAQLKNKCGHSHGAVEKVGGGVDDDGKVGLLSTCLCD